MGRLSRYFIFSLSVLFLRCSDSETVTPPVREYLVSANPTDKYSVQNFRVYAAFIGIDALTNLIQYDIQVYKIVYTTQYKGEPIEASGLVYVPLGLTEAAPMLSLHHGTIMDKDDAPSVTGEFSGLEFFGSAGYITMVPDFVGYGESSEIFHPFYDEQHASNTVIDMILATKEFLKEENILVNDKLFLAGYSEGGYVTLATAKEIDANPVPDLSLVAVAAGAGGYDLENLLDEIISNEAYVYPSYFAFLVMAYNKTNDWNYPLTHFFNEPYAEALSLYMNGEYSGAFINEKLTNNLQDFLEEDFYNELINPESESIFIEALRANSVNGWITSLPIRLYHGEQDEIIPYENSEATLQNFQGLGSENVSLTLFPFGNHVEVFTPTLVNVIIWFDELK